MGWAWFDSDVELSPSTRRAWIEIWLFRGFFPRRRVALHPEGVDRNADDAPIDIIITAVALHPEGVDRNRRPLFHVNADLAVALHPEGVDRNIKEIANDPETPWSPSTRRAWIEIKTHAYARELTTRRPPPGGRG